MIYLTPPSSKVNELYASRHLGVIITPDSDRPQRYDLLKFSKWGADNGCFSTTYRFCGDRYIYWLMSLKDCRENCLFATAPDVVGSHSKTWALRHWLGCIRAIGFPPAFVAQDGWDSSFVDWDAFDVLFVGGTNDFKLGSVAVDAIKEAKDRGKWVHVGRVNSKKRIDYFKELDVDSVDGTFITFGPDVNFKKLERWMEDVNDHNEDIPIRGSSQAAICWDGPPVRETTWTQL